MAALHGEAVITIKKIAFTDSATADTDYQIDHLTQGVISVDVEKQLGVTVKPGWPSPACPPVMGDGRLCRKGRASPCSWNTI